MKAQPALFEGEGMGEPKNEARLFQSTVDIHFQNAHKTRRLALCVYLFLFIHEENAHLSKLFLYRSLDDLQEASKRYWPISGSENFGYITITLMKEQSWPQLTCRLLRATRVSDMYDS